MRALFNIAVMWCVIAGAALATRAQMAVPPPMPAYQLLSAGQLDQLLGPIALYPDPLIAQMLPASTFPTEIVLADRYVSGGGDPGLIDAQPWDASVQALARYPNVLQWMDENLSWTTELGQAFLNQPQDVMDSIQRLRRSAYDLGNLRSTPQQEVIDDGGYIEIVPVNTQVIYVPVYQPAVVYYVAASSGPVITFGIGCAIGPWLDFDFDWGSHHIIVWSRAHPRPRNWWHEKPRDRDTRPARIWRPAKRPQANGANYGDRGWGTPVPQPQTVVSRVGHSVSDTTAPRRTPAPAKRPEAPATRPSTPVSRPAPAPVRHPEPVSQPESNGTFIGIQSSTETRAYSNRGQQSMRTVNHSEPASHPAPAQHSTPVSSPTPSGGGHNSGSHNKH